MEKKVLGLHHITAIAGDAQRNYDFYTQTLGLRLVKKTVNFDDPQTYHFYFGDETGSPGTLITFFPWAGVRQGIPGAGMATDIGYSVPKGSLEFWQARFEALQVDHDPIAERFGERYLPFLDPDGLRLRLIESRTPDSRRGWETDSVKQAVAIKGFHSVVLTLNQIKPTAEILEQVFGYEPAGEHENFYRYRTPAVEHAAIVDLLVVPGAARGVNAGGTNHHVAFRVKDEDALMAYRDKILSRGLYITEKIDRDYFYSLYFREPGGVLFEIATDNPGFATDEPVAQLGTALKLPRQYESIREEIENALPPLRTKN